MAKRVVPESERRRRRPTRQGAVLSEQLIVETALRLLRYHGGAGLTVRRLGAALGADPSTLYRYFRGMDELTLAIADELIGRAIRGWRASGEWRADLRGIGLRLHSAYLAHPQAAVLAASRITGRTHEATAIEAILGVLRTAGLENADAVRVYRSLVDLSLAFAALDGAALALPRAVRDADRQMWRTRYGRLTPGTHPHIAATAGPLVACMDGSAYPATLDMLLDSTASRLTRGR
ncbi:TetR/AcrR family transcriptional regulator [Streptomyces albipurpureus]|uniref:TetR/AcrR family transcriptional regulator n=1 Tax=Streptomyces albipurpureus TaxID=2897419 RepID=A0ABT0UKT4_9ACTN|nr:TetR/AcrR family transcriptional regulator [Streptomyces sp. CWNU-1]MCM2389239.1 TetR/AcrR family transcriptional regulator [Streptomyces sp. CWNU-1]